MANKKLDALVFSTAKNKDEIIQDTVSTLNSRENKNPENKYIAQVTHVYKNGDNAGKQYYIVSDALKNEKSLDSNVLDIDVGLSTEQIQALIAEAQLNGANIDTEAEGSHNGENYIAYTFYIENKGEETVNYWYTILIDDVIKNVDEAARVMIYFNGQKTIYAKQNAYTNEPENETIPFYSEKEAVLEQRKDFAPGNIDKFTIVIWLEGDDPDCTDNILGGEIKMHMEIREEYKESNE